MVWKRASCIAIVSLICVGLAFGLLSRCVGRALETEASERLVLADTPKQTISVADLERFEPGRSRRGILEELHWQGEWTEMIRCDDARLCAITYAVCAYGPNDKRGGITVHAVFVDDKFSKFIRWSTDWKDCPVEARLNEKVGDCLRLKRALETPAVSIDDLRSEAVAQKAPPDDVDWGLTAVFLILSPILPSAKRPTTADIKRNAELREQFKAARLDFGMTESEVQETLKAKPIEAGATEAGAYAIYGSNESFSLYWGHLFSNVLVVFREGRLIAAYDICAGAGWREALRRTFGDLEKR